MCDSCPKELCKAACHEQIPVSYVFVGSCVHIHPPCWRPSQSVFEIESNENMNAYLYETRKTLEEAITYAMGIEDTTFEDMLQLTKIRSMINDTNILS